MSRLPASRSEPNSGTIIIVASARAATLLVRAALSPSFGCGEGPAPRTGSSASATATGEHGGVCQALLPRTDVSPGPMVAGCPCTRRPGGSNSYLCPAGANDTTAEALTPAAGGALDLEGQQGAASGVSFALSVPPGALDAPRTLAVTETDLTPPDGFIDESPVYLVEPLGLSFGKPAALRIPYSNVGGSISPGLAIYQASLDDPCTFRRLRDSYVNAGFLQATTTSTGYLIAAVPGGPADPRCSAGSGVSEGGADGGSDDGTPRHACAALLPPPYFTPGPMVATCDCSRLIDGHKPSACATACMAKIAPLDLTPEAPAHVQIGDRINGVLFSIDVPQLAVNAPIAGTVAQTDLLPPVGFEAYSPVYSVVAAGLSLNRPAEIRVPYSTAGAAIPADLAVYQASEASPCVFERLPDSYINAGFLQASLIQGGYLVAARPLPPAAAP